MARRRLLTAVALTLGVTALIATTANPAAAARATLTNPYPNERFAIFDLSDSNHALGRFDDAADGTKRFGIWHAGRTTELRDVVLNSVNDAGQVAGAANGRATVWDTASGTPVARDVSVPGADASSAFAINDAGQILIWYQLPGGTYLDNTHLALRTGSTLTEIPYPASYLPSLTAAQVRLNERGAVAFTGYIVAAYWDGSTFLDVEALVGGDTRLADLNDAGQAAGYATATVDGRYTARSYVLADGRIRWLPQLDGGDWAAATAINNAGTVVGTANRASGHERAVRWAAGTGTIKDLGTVLLGVTSRAADINDNGEIAGSSANPLGNRPVYWDASGRLLDLGSIPLGGAATTDLINNARTVAGWGMAPGNVGPRGLFWTVSP